MSFQNVQKRIELLTGPSRLVGCVCITLIAFANLGCASDCGQRTCNGEARLEERITKDQAGEVCERFQVLISEDGTAVRHGPYWSKRWPVTESGEYVDGKRQGLWTSVWVSGEKSEIWFRDDLYDGLARLFDSKGRLRRQREYRFGKLDGLLMEWDEQGSVTKQEFYSEGVRVR